VETGEEIGEEVKEKAEEAIDEIKKGFNIGTYEMVNALLEAGYVSPSTPSSLAP
jgi:uncharacterized protein (UPF0332 family)